MPISGILAVCRPADLSQVQQAIDGHAWADVHYTSPDGRLVVTIEGDTTDAVMDRLLEIQALPGVLLAAMAEHYIEDDAPELANPATNRGNECMQAERTIRTGEIR